MQNVICPYCGKPAKWMSNEAVYGRRYGRSWMCYYCRDCDAYVGCHNNTRKPLGTPANRELRKLRITAHSLFDPIWREGKMSRKYAYRYLEENTGVRHIGESNERECAGVINFLRDGVRVPELTGK